jgi:hypothetical protein
MGVLAGDLSELAPNRGFLGQDLCERASVVGKTENGGFWRVEDGGSLVEALCSLAEEMNLPVPGRALARRGPVRGRAVALPRRTGWGRTPPPPLPSSSGPLRRIRRACTSLQSSGGGSHSASTRQERGSTSFPRTWAMSHRSSSTLTPSKASRRSRTPREVVPALPTRNTRAARRACRRETGRRWTVTRGARPASPRPGLPRARSRRGWP